MPLATVLATQPLSKGKSGVLIGNGAFLWVGFYHQSVLLVAAVNEWTLGIFTAN